MMTTRTLSGAVERARVDPGRTMVMIALAATALIYAAVLQRGIVNLDDVWLVQDNWIVQELSWSSIHTILFDLESPRRLTLSPEYLPVRDLSVMLDFAVWDRWYGGFHLTNLALYTIAIMLWFRAFCDLGVDRRIAGLAVLVWALHPSHAESVAWLSERKGLLGAMWSGCCAVGYARFRRGGHGGWLALAAAAGVLAVWSKAIAAFAIAGIAVLELYLPAHRRSWRRSLVGLATIGALGLAAFVPVVMLATTSEVVGTSMRAPAGRLEMAVGVLGFYAQHAAAVVRNAVSYPISTHGPSTVDLVVGALSSIAIAVGFLGRGRWAAPREVRAGLAFFVVGWFPVSHLVLPLQMVFVADRYLLLPTLGLALALAAGLRCISSARARRALTVAICVGLGIRAVDAQTNWRDSSTLWRRAVQSNPSDGSAWSFFADAAQEAGDLQSAFVITAQGLQHSRAPRLVMRYALLHLESKNLRKATVLMRQAAEGGEFRAMANLALLLLEAGMRDEALVWARRCTEVAPRYANGHRIRGKVALADGRADEAVASFEMVLALEPRSTSSSYNLGLALAMQGRHEAARAQFERCLRDPTFADRCRSALAR